MADGVTTTVDGQPPQHTEEAETEESQLAAKRQSKLHKQMEGLTAQKSLFEAYKFFIKFQTISKFNIRALWIFSLILGITLYLQDSNIDVMRGYILALSDLTIQINVSILGFLIAGYTIYISQLKRSHIEVLLLTPFTKAADPKKPDSAPIVTNWFKFINLDFLNVFIQCIAFTISVYMIKSILTCISLSDEWGNECEFSRRLLQAIYLIVSSWSLVILLFLKSFIYNLYNGIMMAVRLNVFVNDDE